MFNVEHSLLASLASVSKRSRDVARPVIKRFTDKHRFTSEVQLRSPKETKETCRVEASGSFVSKLYDS